MRAMRPTPPTTPPIRAFVFKDELLLFSLLLLLLLLFGVDMLVGVIVEYDGTYEYEVAVWVYTTVPAAVTVTCIILLETSTCLLPNRSMLFG